MEDVDDVLLFERVDLEVVGSDVLGKFIGVSSPVFVKGVSNVAGLFTMYETKIILTMPEKKTNIHLHRDNAGLLV